MSSEESNALTPELDLKVQEVAETVFNGMAPQTINRWIREIKRDYGIDVGYTKVKAKWLTPQDIDVLRQYQEGSLQSSSDVGDRSGQTNDDRFEGDIEEAADEGFQTFSKITDEADQELSKALAIRDQYVEDRAAIIAQEFHPDTIARDIMTRAISKIKTGGSESLGEVARGGMHRPFTRRVIEVEPIRSLNGTSQNLLESKQP